MKCKQLFFLGFLSVFSLSASAQATTNTILGFSTQNPYQSISPTLSLRNTLLGCEINGSTTVGSLNLGSDNTVVGYQGGYHFKDAELNSDLGSFTGFSNTIGDRNVNLGAYSGYTNNSGNDNVNVGAYSGYTSSTKHYNVFVGGYSGKANNVDGSTFVGYNSGLNNSTGLRNVFFGFKCGEANTIGADNTFLGYEAGKSNVGTSTTGLYNTYLGKSAGAARTTGSSNVILGCEAGEFGTAGNYEVFVGQYAGRDTTGDSNVFIGHGAGMSNTTGTSNVFIGHVAGAYTTGTANVFIGAGCNIPAPLPAAPISNKLLIETNPTALPTPPTALVYGDFFSRKIGIGLRNLFPANADNFPVATSGQSLSNCRLFVDGGIVCTSNLIVSAFANWADYVFEDDYTLTPLEEVEAYIQEKGHLKNIPSTKDVAEKGLDLPAITALQQEKIEELTLYLIQQNKEIKELQGQNREMLEQLRTLLGKK
jgi:hypothetical protein